MAGFNSRNAPVRKLRQQDNPSIDHLPTEHLVYVGLLAELCLYHRRGVYIGAPSTVGGFKVRVYGPDETLETYVSLVSSPREAMGELVNAAFGEKAEAAMHQLAAAGIAERAAEGFGDAIVSAKPRSGGKGA